MLIVAFSLLTSVALQQTEVNISMGSGKGTTIRVIAHDADSTRKPDNEKPIVATAEQLATAFLNPDARTLLARARAARIGQDSSLREYDASALQRTTLGLAVTRFGRERIVFRHEVATRVRWDRAVGARIDVTGRRTVVPLVGGPATVEIESVVSPIPYYPGRDALWIGLTRSNPSATHDEIIHPLANGAEALYTYRAGDSISFRLPDGTSIHLRELEVRPRKADWHTVVGSLWFDTRTGQLVRAAYRLSQPVDLLHDDDDDHPGFLASALLRPSTATITGVAVEYGLYQGRFWLPRTQVGEGKVQVGFVRMPMRIEEHFTYNNVNALDSIPVMPPPRSLNSGRVNDSVRVAQECAATGTHSVRATRYGGTLPILVTIPCDTAKLAHSPDLPASIFDPGDEVFSDAERDALLAKAESMVPNLPVGPQLPRVDWGFEMLRYNRVEGLSSALDITQDIGSAYSIRFTPRFGVADRIPNAELAFSRHTPAGTTTLSGYRRLVAANDWGNPLDVGSGLSALLFGRDEGFYYRTAGAELSGDRLLGHSWQWRLFSERESDAAVRTNASLAKALGSDGFDPLWNIAAPTIVETGVAVRNLSSFGFDPNAFRFITDLRLEGAGGDRAYSRGALDVTMSHPIGRMLSRNFSTSITVGAGTSAGNIPAQRHWYLGGTSTVRGEAAGVMVGNSYWLTRTEIGYGLPGFRRIAFFDLGWAGDRSGWNAMGRPASGAGIGWSMLDGLVRADVARGIYPLRQWRGALYLDAKF